MSDMSLWNQYTQAVQWIERLPRAQYALANGGIWFTVWIITQVLLGESLLYAAVVGGITAIVFGGLHYYLWEYR